MTIISTILMVVSIIVVIAGVWLIYFAGKKRWANETKEMELYARSLELDEIRTQLEKERQDAQLEMEKERTLLYQQTINELEKISKKYREDALREAVSEAEREYNRQVALMKEDVDKYAAHLDKELEESAQSFIQYTTQIGMTAEQLENQVCDLASRLVSLMEAEKSLLDESRQKTLMLPLSREDIADLRLLMEDILPRIRREDVIRKLIWVEYIQKPTFALVSDVFPMGTSGIYKITNIKTKKSYVGRSVDTRARVVEHIKSSLGLGSISDQAIHHAMREEGLENFMFELLEDCEKDKLAEREKYYIGIFQSDTHGYNKNKGG